MARQRQLTGFFIAELSPRITMCDGKHEKFSSWLGPLICEGEVNISIYSFNKQTFSKVKYFSCKNLRKKLLGTLLLFCEILIVSVREIAGNFKIQLIFCTAYHAN